MSRRNLSAIIELFRDDGDDGGWSVMVRAPWCKKFDTAGAHMGSRTLPETLTTVEALVGKRLKWCVGSRCIRAEWHADEVSIIRFGKMLDRIGEDADER